MMTNLFPLRCFRFHVKSTYSGMEQKLPYGLMAPATCH